MSNLEIVKYKERLDNLFGQVSVFEDDLQLQSHWSRYLCILVSGFIETSVINIYSQYAEKRSHTYIANYVSFRLKRFTNPKMDDILTLAGSFSKDWENRLESTVPEEQKAAVDSIVAHRNRIAHGANYGISYVTLKNYYENVVKFIKILEETCC